MLWYLLWPIRGTTQPPRLSANHPIRKAFYRHGKTTAQHWLVTMLFSVAIAMAFSYPTIFLGEFPTTGFTTYPNHVWTSAKRIDSGDTTADIEMRQIWIHGSYMKALDKEVLKQGLIIQQSLIEDERLSFDSLPWGYHSPLMYWNNSAENIEADTDVLKTVNEQRHGVSSLNVVLRPASVFAGKKFDRHQLLAADALVITLTNKVEDRLSTEWQEKMKTLTTKACRDCTLFPQDGHVTRQRVYEFSFMPLSTEEIIALTVAYSVIVLYVLLSLRRMKAFHSRFGLVVTAITQMTSSILASFTICGLLRINLSMIPQNAYPFVVHVIGLENMFRLINAVLAYPPTMATDLRIANALGDIGPLSLATAAQNLTILSLLSVVVSPGVAAFCAFAAIATLFDAFFLLTFFVAVLNVDIRRLELQDALTARHNQAKHRGRHSPSQHPWLDALIQGRLPFSTRMAGTAVTTTFIITLNYHFFEHKETTTGLRRFLGLAKGGPPSLSDLDTFMPPPMNATLTPGEWMRIQDFDAVTEVMRLAKPGADSFAIRIFAPLIIVLPGSDRTGVPRMGEAWTHALRDFALHHFYPVAVAVVFAVAFVSVLMNFLLYNETGDEENETDLDPLEDSLTVQTIGLPHKLDIVKMTSAREHGHLVTVGLDRTIAISIADKTANSQHTIAAPMDVLSRLRWPIHHLAIDQSGQWLACHGADDNILMYNCSTGSIISQLLRYPDDHPAVLFEFVLLQTPVGSQLYFITLTSGGRLATSAVDDPKADYTDLSRVPLVGAAVIEASSRGRRLISVTEDGTVTAYTWSSTAWIEVAEQRLLFRTSNKIFITSASIEVHTDHDSELLLVGTSRFAIFLDIDTLGHVAMIDFSDILEHHIETLFISPSKRCPSCGSLAFQKLAVLTSVLKKDRFIFVTWSSKGGNDSGICLSHSSTLCKTLNTAKKETLEMDAPGAWYAVKSQAVIGLRKRKPPFDMKGVSHVEAKFSGLRQRGRSRRKMLSDEGPEQWEAYRLSIHGHLETIDVSVHEDPALSPDTALYVDSAGPVVALDSQTIAVAFGNHVKIIRASRRGSMSRRSTVSSLDRQSSTSRRLTTVRRGR